MAAFDNLITTLHAAARTGFNGTIDAAMPKSRKEAADRLVEFGGEWEDGTTPRPGAQGKIPVRKAISASFRGSESFHPNR